MQTTETLEPDVTTVEPSFRIDSIEKAEWLLRKLGNLEAEKKRIQAQAAAMIRQLENDTWNLNRLFGEQLEEFVREELCRRGGRRRSLTLLQGTCAFRTVPGGFRLADPAAALQYVREETGECTDLIDLVPRLKTEEYRILAERHLETTGELLPGCEVRPERETFTVKFGKTE